ncbi:DUF624 domain-containing protein [Rhizomonospora bruguierae]|uniref:DUF624 domain-containing protein n=1 Tax=Rhizomonospora bruguierae TaxID=1581705 RepID=UPI001BCF5B6F|nr:DUF624 domain-containing protein [Micromonospora sp. NBRC 107566]
MTAPTARFGVGPLSRAAALIYTVLVVECLVLLTTVPLLVPVVLLDRDASNIPLAALCALPVGPALSAALYALHHRQRDLTDLHPTTLFWRGYRMNAAGALRVWVPLVVLLAVVAINLAHFGAANVPGWWAPMLVVVAVAGALWGANALVITSLFAFRAVDVARLALYFLGRTPVATLGNAGVLVAAVAVTALASEAVLALVGAVLVLVLLRTSRPMIDTVRREFTA